MAEDSGIDPRYAAQFQRGFDPTRDAPPVRRGPVRLEGGPPPTAPRVPDPPPVVERRVEPGVSVPDEAAEDLPQLRSRLEWALLGTGVVLLVLAAVLFSAAVELYSRYTGWGSDFGSQLWGAAANVLPGPLLVGGVAAITAWLVLRGLTGGGRSS
jgi:hypothetical protein